MTGIEVLLAKLMPAWLTESRVAIIISGLSATFTGMHWIHARRLSRNDSIRMRRKAPVFEAQMEGDDNVFGWRFMTVTIRNLESVSADITHATTRRRRQLIAHRKDAYRQPEQEWGEPTLRDDIPWQRTVLIGIRVAPVGTARHPHGASPGAVERVQLLCKGVSSISDLKFEWSWSDGHRD